MNQKPKQYIQGWVEFYKLKFLVTPDVLIPRPETELLVDAVLNFLSVRPPLIKGHPVVLDIGTGAGPIAISVAKNCPDVKIIATDISKPALEVARKNAKLHGVEKQIIFLQSDLLSSPSLPPIIHKTGPIILVCNLPYIPSARIPYLDSSVKDFEPHLALDGGEDGFDLYRKLFQQIAQFSLPPQGWHPKLIVGEIDYTQAEVAIWEVRKFFPKAQVEVRLDLAHKQRILLARP